MARHCIEPCIDATTSLAAKARQPPIAWIPCTSISETSKIF